VLRWRIPRPYGHGIRTALERCCACTDRQRRTRRHRAKAGLARTQPLHTKYSCRGNGSATAEVVVDFCCLCRWVTGMALTNGRCLLLFAVLMSRSLQACRACFVQDFWLLCVLRRGACMAAQTNPDTQRAQRATQGCSRHHAAALVVALSPVLASRKASDSYIIAHITSQ
jgi:hypothetical protein